MARRYYSSTAARTTLASGVDDTTTTLSVVAVSGWPATYPYTLVLDQDTVNEELVEVSARSGTTLTVTRGVDGTSAVAHDAGAAVNHGVSARDFDEPNDHVNDGTTDVHPQYLLESAAATTYVSQAGGSTVTASGASVVPLTLKGASGQTANLLTVENSAGNDLVVVEPSGAVLIGTTTPGSASTGDLVVNGGVFLGGSAAANELDDYEEGTWTPVYDPSSGAFSSISYSPQEGRYTKIGNTVVLYFRIGVSALSLGTAASILSISGLPFAASFRNGGVISYAVNFAGDHPSSLFINPGDQTIRLQYRDAPDGQTFDLNVADLDVSDTNFIIGQLSYFTA